MGCISDEPAKNGREVPLCLKSRIQCDLDKSLRCVHQQPLGVLDAPPKHKVVRTLPCRSSKLAREIHPAQAGGVGKTSECDPVGDIGININKNPQQTPFR
jgi:hypothetical protein